VTASFAARRGEQRIHHRKEKPLVDRSAHPLAVWRLAGIAVACLFILTLGGCIHAPGGIAASNVPIDGRSYHVVGETSATDSSIWLLGILPITGSNTTAAALHQAMQKKDADALIGITVEAYTQFWILFARHVTEVKGTAVKFD
jgi:hypothetical protein